VRPEYFADRPKCCGRLVVMPLRVRLVNDWIIQQRQSRDSECFDSVECGHYFTFLFNARTIFAVTLPS
jgi:hypothetical protein